MNIVSVRDLRKTFRVGSFYRRIDVEAVKGVSFDIPAGTTYGLVGESGSGKSTVARLVSRLSVPTSGRIEFEGSDVAGLTGPALMGYRRNVQMVFQDPYAALNPRMTVAELVIEPYVVHRLYTRSERLTRARQLLDRVGLPASSLEKKPTNFSGGQRQRIMIARALAMEPRLIIADEPVSALDVSVQAQVLNLLKDLQEELGLSYLFISHDMAVVDFISDRVGVMNRGVLVEEGTPDEIIRHPQHEYTAALIAAIPRIAS
ncbi:MAG TPA: ATP-binding cassette domain-containing protein [Propionibacteriaceae bacterium]|nr:ATP-binding cassette domain-containing protein [Propionibacteriaceae bacterium]